MFERKCFTLFRPNGTESVKYDYSNETCDPVQSSCVAESKEDSSEGKEDFK